MKRKAATMMALVLAAGCGGGGVSMDRGPVSMDAVAEGGDDGGGDLHQDEGGEPGGGPPDTAGVIPEQYIPPGSMRFEMGGRDGDFILVRVVARDLGEVYGAALRVRWDPGTMELGDQSALEHTLGEDAVYKKALLRPGDLSLAMTLTGDRPGPDLSGDRILATLRMKPSSAGELHFFEPRCLVLRSDLSQVEVVYMGAVVQP